MKLFNLYLIGSKLVLNMSFNHSKLILEGKNQHLECKTKHKNYCIKNNFFKK